MGAALLVNIRQLNILFLRKGVFYALFFFMIEWLVLFGRSWFLNTPCALDYYRLQCQRAEPILNIQTCSDFQYVCDNITTIFSEYGCSFPCVEFAADKSDCGMKQTVQDIIYYFLVFFNLLSCLYLYMGDYDLVKNNIQRTKLFAKVNKIVEARRNNVEKVETPESRLSNDDTAIEMSEITPKGKNESEVPVNRRKESEKEEESEPAKRESEKNFSVIELFYDEVLESAKEEYSSLPPEDENFCAWDYEDLGFLISTIFMNLILIMFTVSASLKKPPYCSGGTRPSSFNYTCYAMGMFFITILLVFWVVLKNHLSRMNAKWNNRQSSHWFLSLVRMFRYFMMAAILLYIIQDVVSLYIYIFRQLPVR